MIQVVEGAAHVMRAISEIIFDNAAKFRDQANFRQILDRYPVFACELAYWSISRKEATDKLQAEIEGVVFGRPKKRLRREKRKPSSIVETSSSSDKIEEA